MLSLEASNHASFLPRITMKQQFLYLFLLAVLIGCKNENKLTFEPRTIENEACSNCPTVAIHLPKVIDQTKIAQTVNTALEEEIISLLLYDDALEITNLKDAIQSFKNGYFDLQNLYDDESTNWEAKIDCKVTFEDDNFLTIELDSYLFTGGAHGYTSKRLLNFSKKESVELENWQLFKNEENFRVFAESIFREKQQIPKDKPINHTGFMFERDSFYLPENIGFTKDGLKLLYNTYEVASYADGVIEILISFEEVKKYLAKKSKS